MKTAVTFALLLIATHGAADDTLVPEVVHFASQLNTARQARLRAEISLQETILAARQSLLEDGHAAAWEVASAKADLDYLHTLGDAISAYAVLLREVLDALNEDLPTSPADRHIAIPLPHELVQHIRSKNRFWLAADDTELRKLSAQIAVSRRQARGQRQALNAEFTYVSEYLDRLRRIDDRSVSTSREIELNSMKLAVIQTQLTMMRCQREYSASLELLHQQEQGHGFPIKLCGETFEDLTQLADFLQRTWEFQWTRVEQAAIEIKSEMPQEYRASPSDFESGRTADAIARLRPRVIRLAELAATDAVSARELEYRRYEQDVLQGRAQVERETEALHQLAGHFAEVSYFVATQTPEASKRSLLAGRDETADIDKTLLAFYEFAANRRGELDLATSQVSLQVHKLAGLQSLRELGYASWTEVAKAKRDLAVAQARRLAAIEQQQIAKLEYQRAQRAIGTRRSDEHSVAIAH